MSMKAESASETLFQQLARLSLASFDDYSELDAAQETFLFRTHDGKEVQFRTRSAVLAEVLPELKLGAQEALGFSNPGLKEAGYWLCSMINEKAEDMSAPGKRGYDLTSRGFLPWD